MRAPFRGVNAGRPLPPRDRSFGWVRWATCSAHSVVGVVPGRRHVAPRLSGYRVPLRLRVGKQRGNLTKVESACQNFDPYDDRLLVSSPAPALRPRGGRATCVPNAGFFYEKPILAASRSPFSFGALCLLFGLAYRRHLMVQVHLHPGPAMEMDGAVGGLYPVKTQGQPRTPPSPSMCCSHNASIAGMRSPALRSAHWSAPLFSL